MRFLLLNQFIPPDPAPTARLLGDVAELLGDKGHEVVLVGDRSDYRGKKTFLGSRALRELKSLLRMLLGGVFTKRCEAILFLTSPPMLSAVARMVGWRHRGSIRIHWVMDIYPEIAAALGEVGEKSLAYRIANHMATLSYQACDLVVAIDRDMSRVIATHGVSAEVFPLWPHLSGIQQDSSSKQPSRDSDAFVWLYSGNLGKAHEWRTLLETQVRLERKGLPVDLVFQGGGTEIDEVHATAGNLGLKRVTFRPYVESDELIESLLAADCLIVTQRPETRGCLWPSKLALATQLGRPVIFVGAGEGSVHDELQREGHFCHKVGDSVELSETIDRLLREKREFVDTNDSSSEVLERIREVREKALVSFVDRILDASSAINGSDSE